MRANRDLLAIGGIGLAVLLFLAVNLLAHTTLGRVRLDLTEAGLYTLSDETRRTLQEIEEPIELRLYLSDALSEAGPGIAEHARRVRETLQEYVRLADGRLELKVLRPEPFSPVEDQAVADGLRGVTLGDGRQTVYFGLAGENSTDDREAIPLFAPERARFLEYDLTRLIASLANPEKPVVGVLGAISMAGDPAAGVPPWRVMQLMRQGYEVKSLRGRNGAIPDDVEILVLVQPSGLTPAARYAVDQYVQRGGRVLVFADPFAEVLAYAGGERRETDAARLDRGARDLLASWGLSIDPDTVVGDRANARRVQARVNGRDTVVDYLGWLLVPPDHLSQDDPVTASLGQLAFKSVGAIRTAAEARTPPDALALSSQQAMPLPVERIQDFPNPAALLADFAASGDRYVLTARVDGPVRSAFPAGPPAGVTPPPDGHLAQSRAPAHVIAVADADLLADGTWTRPGQSGSDEVTVPLAANGSFVINALDNLSGGGGLAGLRSRGLAERPFTLLEEMRKAAESKYRAREQALSQRVDAAQRRIRELRRREAETGVVMGAEQRAEIERLRADLVEARGELREVQHKLYEDVERVQRQVRLANVWGMPALVALIAVVLALVRRARRARAPVAAG